MKLGKFEHPKYDAVREKFDPEGKGIKQADIDSTVKDFYLYGDLSKIDTKELKKSLHGYINFGNNKDDDTIEAISRIEEELLSRRDVEFKEDFVFDEPINLIEEDDEQF